MSTPTAAQTDDRTAVTFSWENDQRIWRDHVFALFDFLTPDACDADYLPPDVQENCAALQSDRYYTNGLKLSVLRLHRWKHGSWAIGGVVGQSLYTPALLTEPEFQPLDRPYGAWLYGGVTAAVATRRWQHAIEIDLGCTGRCAKGKATQTKVHHLINALGANAAIPTWSAEVDKGWVGQGFYEVKFQPDSWRGQWGDEKWDLTLGGGGGYGEVFQHINASATFRFFGRNLLDFPPSVDGIPGQASRDTLLASSTYVDRETRWTLEPRYVFIAVDVRALRHNAFLDEFPSKVRKRPHRWDFAFGVVLPPLRFTIPVLKWRVACPVTWQRVLRSREFDRQPQAFWFGSFSFRWRFK